MGRIKSMKVYKWNKSVKEDRTDKEKPKQRKKQRTKYRPKQKTKKQKPKKKRIGKCPEPAAKLLWLEVQGAFFMEAVCLSVSCDADGP